MVFVGPTKEGHGLSNVEAWKNAREVCIVGIGLHKFSR
jgi:hypothetical protein